MRTKSVIILLALAMLLIPAIGQDNTASYWLGKADELAQKESYKDSIDYYKKALDLEPSNIEALCGITGTLNSLADIKKFEGSYEESEGSYEEAFGYASNATKVAPNNSEAWNGLGWSYEGLRNFDKAIECYNKAIDLNPGWVEPWNNIGICYLDLRDYNKALYYFDKAIELDPKYGDAWSNKGDALEKLGKLEEADAAEAKAGELGSRCSKT